jgi:hypothetical protein
MDVVSTAIIAGVGSAVGLILAYLGKGRLDAVQHRLDASISASSNESTALGRMDGLENRMGGSEDRIEQRIDVWPRVRMTGSRASTRPSTP